MEVVARERQRLLGTVLVAHEEASPAELARGCEVGWTVEIELSKEQVRSLLENAEGTPSGQCRLVGRFALVEVTPGEQPLVPVVASDGNHECEEAVA